MNRQSLTDVDDSCQAGQAVGILKARLGRLFCGLAKRAPITNTERSATDKETG
jgi:hypothetical protein